MLIKSAKPQVLDFKFDSKAADDGTFSGYASVFGNVDRGFDIIEKGAFTTTLEGRNFKDVKLLRGHDPDKLIGFFTNIKQDEKGLHVEGKILTDLALGKETYLLVKEGALDGMSIGYMPTKWEYTRDADGTIFNRVLKQVDLFEISLVAFPMNTEARVDNVKNEWTVRDVERALRDAGAPSSFAKAIASSAKQVIASNSESFVGSEDNEQTKKLAQQLLNSIRGK